MRADTDVLVTHEPGISLITFNRPARRNAFTARGYRQFARALEQAASAPEIAVAVVTGRGAAFSAGVDLKAFDNPAEHAALSAGFDQVLNALVTFPKPLIAAVNGAAVGFGMTMLLHFDLVLANENARFRAPFTELGLVPEAGSSDLLPRALGAQQATWLCLSGDWMEAPDAAKAGLVWRCVAGRVLDDALEVARQVRMKPTIAVQATKQLLTFGRRERIAEALRREHDTMVALVANATPDFERDAGSE